MVRRTSSNSRGDTLADRFYAGRTEAERALVLGARELPILEGVTPKCEFFWPQEVVLQNAGEILARSNRIFRLGNQIVFEVQDGGDRRLQPISTAHAAEGTAAALLSNVLVCGISSVTDPSDSTQFPPPKKLVELVVNREPTISRLRRINVYAARPLFDDDFNFCGPGWHDEIGYLIHGPDVEPIETPLASADRALGRLPPRLRSLFADFCFKSDADVINAVGALLTGLLVGHFIRGGKAVNLLDGNQPSVGKTLFARVIGIVLDGVDPALIRFTTDDDELEKRICANLRGGCASVLVFDNAKVRGGMEINSAVLELNSTAAQISLRILGKSANLTRPNDLLWFVTMNSTKASSDLIARSMPIRFFYTGKPEDRSFGGRDPLEIAERYRVEILGELVGMVVRWTQMGRPLGQQQHRLSYWASIIGGVLNANGLSGFLSNTNEAAVEFNPQLEQLAALAERAIPRGGPLVRFLSAPSQPLQCDERVSNE